MTVRSVGDVTQSIDAEFGWQVRAARERNGWSQARLGQEIGLDGSGVSRLEAGRKKLGLTEAVRVGEALGVSLDRLMTPIDARAALTQALDRVDEAVGRARAQVVEMVTALEGAAILAEESADAVVRDVFGCDAASVRDELTVRVSKVAGGGERVAVSEDSTALAGVWVAALGERISE